MNTYRYPSITGTTEEQLRQLKNYLYSLVEQLNNTPRNTGVSVSYSQGSGVSASEGEETSPAATFAALKSFIIKSADIVDAYCDKISHKLSGVYVAQSEFGDYARQTENAITANAVAIEQNYTHLEQVITDLQTREQDTKAYIRTGLLYYAGAEDPLPEGTPVYGVEVGQQNDEEFRRFGRFTAYGMTFYDENGAPAAQITKGQLKIAHAVVTGSFTEGGFCHEVRPDGSLVTRWQGV